jgi:hypothetical protein
MDINLKDRVRFNGMLDHVRAIVASAGTFDPKSRNRISASVDRFWTELRNARKRQVLAEQALRP